MRVLDTRSHSAIAQVEFSCDPINPGDVVMPFVEKPPIAFHVPEHFDRFAPANGKFTGRIVLGKDFDGVLGTGMKLYMNMGSNQGVKVGDYFRVVRSYTATLHDPVTRSHSNRGLRKIRKLGRRLSKPIASPGLKGRTFTWLICRDAPWEIVVVLNVTPTSSSGMVVFALEDVYAGDTVELDDATVKTRQNT